MLNPAGFGVAIGLSGIAIEYMFARRMGRTSIYRFSSTLANLSCAFGSQAVALVLPPTTLILYKWVYEHWAPFHLSVALAWPIGLLLHDFLYYWTHRLSHEWSLLWAAHAVHHHSEDFNITVSAREPYIGLFMLAPFFLPLALLGVPPIVYLVGVALHVGFGYLEHTQLVGRLPRPFEWLFATPSNHRVHHAVNPEYLDKNYGAIFMIWDRLFGTYEPERAPCVFGVTKPLTSLNPIWANVEHWSKTYDATRRVNGIREKANLVFGPPAKVHRALTQTVELEAAAAPTRVRGAPSRLLTTWIIAHTAFVSLVIGGSLLKMEALTTPQRFAAAAFVVLTSVTLPALLEERRFAWPLEMARVVGFAIVFYAIH